MRNEEVDLSDIVKTITAQLKKAEPGRQVEFVIAENAKHVADERLLHAALENLIDNSWKFTRRNPRARIEFGITVLDGETAYFVRDDGAGFDMKYADKLFTPFKRLHNADEFPGTGIGLATVKRIIHRHGGRIWFEAEKGKGATFYFTLGQQVSYAGRPTDKTDTVSLAAATKR
jgi:light-regulated signal transduction histidine kinase (bacteriophytochrome)